MMTFLVDDNDATDDYYVLSSSSSAAKDIYTYKNTSESCTIVSPIHIFIHVSYTYIGIHFTVNR